MKEKETKRKEEKGIPVTLKEEDEYTVLHPVEEISEEAKPELPSIREEKIRPQQPTKRTEEQRRSIEKAKEEMRKLPTDMIETEIDKLLEMIERKGSVDVLEASKKLGVDVEQVEEWAKILEERGLLEIVYPLIGFPRLRKREWKKKS